MRTRIMLLLTAASLAAGGFAIGSPFAPAATPTTKAEALPYYDSRDFTPRWSPVSHEVAPFALTDQTNQSFTEKDLEGKIHVASFLFAECPSLCPTLVQKLKPVQEAIHGWNDVLMVSYSVTPLSDTPEVLAEFGRRRGIDADRWHLLTGSLNAIQSVIRDSYFADDNRAIEGEPGSRLLHTEKVLLVDKDRRLRGIYNGTNAFEMQRLVEDIQTLRDSN